MAELIVRSKIKEVAKEFNVAGDFADALDKMAVEQVNLAVGRASANGRRTVQAKDVAKTHNVAGDFAEALNEMIVWSVMQAGERAKANGRRTIQARDL